MKAAILKTKPGARFHFGEYAPFMETFLHHTSSFPHSDTIFSALVNLCASVWPEDTKRLIALFVEGKVRISSGLFCFEGNKDYLFFFPKPVFYTVHAEDWRKKIKKLEWVSKGIWARGLEPLDDTFLIDNRFICLQDEWNSIHSDKPDGFIPYKTLTRPQVQVHTETTEDNLYHQTDVVIGGGRGLKVHYYILIDDDQLPDQDKKWVTALFNMLTDTGLGGQRSTGCGLFDDIHWVNVSIPVSDNADHFVNLSLLSPNESSLNQYLSYKLVIRGGRINEREQMKKLRMICEGALLGSDVKGRIVDLSTKGNARYLRYGMSINLPVHYELSETENKNENQ